MKTIARRRQPQPQPQQQKTYLLFVLSATISTHFFRMAHGLASPLRSPPSTATTVAVLGSGIAGSTAARYLAEHGMKVTVIESGRGPGGRTSTRISRDDFQYRFDHGAQYIGKPKTEIFQKTLDEWLQSGFVKEWDGKFGTVTDADGTIVPETPPGKPHYVGYPSMDAICQNLLDHQNIDTVFQTRACATWKNPADGAASSSPTSKWILTAHGEKGQEDQTPSSSSSPTLGEFDWLVASDRLSATNNRADLRDAPVDDFKSLVSNIQNIPSLTLMVSFASSLDNIPLDGIQFDDINSNSSNSNRNSKSDTSSPWSSLAWAARDTSKPGRERNDGHECWVVQSNVRAAQELISTIAESAPKGQSFDLTKKKVAKAAQEMMMNDFLKAVKILNGGCVPKVTYSIGHRWSAAFPGVTDVQKQCEHYFDKERQFVACGDYMGSLTGRIEGAYLSGMSAVSCVVNSVTSVVVD